MDNIGERLREERERLGMSQAAFGQLAGVKKNAQFNYEAGHRSPDSEYLSAVARHGADVLYILTGRRTPGHELIAQIRRKYGRLIDLGDLADNIERLTEAEAASGAARPRDDLERWAAAIAAVEEGLAQTGGRLPPAARAELTLAAYDLLEDDTPSSKQRVIRLVKTSSGG